MLRDMELGIRMHVGKEIRRKIELGHHDLHDMVTYMYFAVIRPL